MVSIIIPVVRAKKATRCIDLINKNAGLKDFEIIVAHDHERIGCPKMVQALVNETKYEYVMFLGDDTLPRDNFLYHAMESMKGFKDEWGLVGLNDLTGRSALPCHWLAHKRVLELTDGSFFHTGYKHSFCDMELRDIAVEHGRYAFSMQSIVEHDHPILQDQETSNPDYIRVYSEEYTTHDNNLYLQRKKERHKAALGGRIKEPDYKNEYKITSKS